MRGLLGVLVMATAFTSAQAASPGIGDREKKAAVEALLARYGSGEEARIRRGVEQVAARWWPEDGSGEDFVAFCGEHFLPKEELGRAFTRLEAALEQIEGHLHEVRRFLTTPLDLDTGPVSKVDALLAKLDLASHLSEDVFGSKVAHLALLNFPVHSLQERLAEGEGWSRETWAQSRLMDRFALRIPAEVGKKITEALLAADQYVANYNIPMDRLRYGNDHELFPKGLKLISHWGLRDELKSWYGQPGGLPRQRLIQQLMLRIVRQELPLGLLRDGELTYDPFSGFLVTKDGRVAPADASFSEPDTRYQLWLANFRALQAADAYSPVAPTAIARAFTLERQIPEEEVERVFTQVLASEEVRRLGRYISKRLGRPLEPFDIWFADFSPRAGYSEEELNQLVRSRYPTVQAFQADLPSLLEKLGFSREKARFLADHIVVEPARGAGHAMGAVRREDKAHLRTRVGPSGMDYKGFNIAIHELGHNVEQVFSLNSMDHWALAGVPNNAFTEAFAFAFQGRDLELLGLPSKRQKAEQALSALWATYEIAGVALVDLEAWRWLYSHPQATAEELKGAVLAAARGIWNRFYAPIFGQKDCELLAIYSHMIAYPLYLADYPLGHLIAFQLSERLQGPDFGQEVERMARLGKLTPDAWLKAAVGQALSPEPLLRAARRALESMGE
ncbi:MAG: hypothetical protein ACUVRE_05705 [Thermoanaerobaculaceae bacterium]